MSASIPTAHAIQPWPSWQRDIDDDGTNGSPLRGKRSRVALACLRCKTRKQKCDGIQPCTKCKATNQHCEYVIPQKPMPFGKQHYIKALEHRVAELETILATHGRVELSSDHWKTSVAPNSGADAPSHATTTATSASQSPTRTDTSENDLNDAVLDWRDGVDSVSSVLRSLSLDVNGSGYVGASSHIAFGRLFSFIGGSSERNSMTPRQHAVDQAQSIGTASESPIEFCEMVNSVADRLFGGYQKHIASKFGGLNHVDFFAGKFTIATTCLTAMRSRNF